MSLLTEYNTMKYIVKTVAIVTALALSATASAFWNPKDWDMKDGWNNNNDSDHPLAPFGWGSKDGRGPFGGTNGWGAMDSMVDSMGMGDAMSDMNTDVEWDLNLDTKLKGQAQAEGKGNGKSESKARNRARSDFREDNRRRYYPGYNQPPAAPYGYGPVPYGYGPQPYGPMGPSGQMPFAPAMPPQMMMPPRQYWR